jgi:competence protein ComEA
VPSTRSRRADRARRRLSQLLVADLPVEPEPTGPPASSTTAWVPAEEADEPTRWVPRSGGRALLLVVALALAVGLGWWVVSRPRGVPVAVHEVLPSTVAAPSGESPAASGSASPSPSVAPSPAGQVVVDVEGRVRRPGVVRLPLGARVLDALHAAGGVRPGTSTRRLNLARVLVDGEQLWVGPNAPIPAGAPAAGSPGASTATGQVNLNTATLDQLDSLPGIGPVLAQRILDWRSAHGRFATTDQLKDVSGIGDATFADLAGLVTV